MTVFILRLKNVLPSIDKLHELSFSSHAFREVTENRRIPNGALLGTMLRLGVACPGRAHR